MPTKLTPEHYRALAQACGYEWLDTEVKNNATKTRWRCPKGHIWHAPYTSLQQGVRCVYCAGSAAKTPQDYENLAHLRGFEWYSCEVPANVMAKTSWRCSEGHEWEARYNDIRRGDGCPCCSKNKRVTLRDYCRAGDSIGIEWTGKELPATAQTKTEWRCSKGHTWFARYSTINTGVGCPHCAGVAPKLEADYHALAAARDLKWIGVEVPRNTKTKTLWLCKNGHTFSTHYNSISVMESGCPACHDIINGFFVSKPQLKLHDMLGGRLNYRVGRYGIDVALEVGDVKIAVEYDCHYWHNLKYDAKRDSQLIQQGWRILRIKSSELLPTLDQLNTALSLLLSGETYAEIVLPDW